MTNKESIHAIVYTDFHDQIGPNPIYWSPSELSENVRMLVGIKTVTLLSASHGFVPESLIIIPFPSIRLKGIIKYIEREEMEFTEELGLLFPQLIKIKFKACLHSGQRAFLF